jgi:hypothetical protein
VLNVLVVVFKVKKRNNVIDLKSMLNIIGDNYYDVNYSNDPKLVKIS